MVVSHVLYVVMVKVCGVHSDSLVKGEAADSDLPCPVMVKVCGVH